MGGQIQHAILCLQPSCVQGTGRRVKIEPCAGDFHPTGLKCAGLFVEVIIATVDLLKSGLHYAVGVRIIGHAVNGAYAGHQITLFTKAIGLSVDLCQSGSENAASICPHGRRAVFDPAGLHQLVCGEVVVLAVNGITSGNCALVRCEVIGSGICHCPAGSHGSILVVAVQRAVIIRDPAGLHTAVFIEGIRCAVDALHAGQLSGILVNVVQGILIVHPAEHRCADLCVIIITLSLDRLPACPQCAVRGEQISISVVQRGLFLGTAAVVVIIIKAVVIRNIPACLCDLVCVTAARQYTVAAVCHNKTVQVQCRFLHIRLLCRSRNCTDQKRCEQSAGCGKEYFAHRLRHWFHVLSCQRNTRPPGQHSFLATAVSILQSLSSAFVSN